MSLLGADPTLHETAVRQTMYDELLFTEMRVTSPALDNMIDDLNRDYAYTDVLVADTFAALHQSGPLLRERRDMVPDCMLNHAVATNLARCPEVASLRGYTVHNKYYSAMGTTELAGKVREYLAQAQQDMQDAADAADKAKEKADQAQDNAERQRSDTAQAQDAAAQAGADLNDAEQALADALAALAAAMGDFDGNGPLTSEQADAQAAADDAAISRDEAVAAHEAATEAAIDAADILAQLLQLAEQARQDAEAADREVEEVVSKAERATRVPVNLGVHEAIEEIALQAANFSAWGVDEADMERMDFNERAAQARRLKNHRLKDWAANIGRFKMLQTVQYAQKVAHARDEVYDVTLTGHLPDVLPSQFALLATEPGKVDFLRRLTERQLLGLKHRGKEKIGQGAIIYLCDTSGSMKKTDAKGIPREVFAKGMMLALLDQARDEGRDFVGIIFGPAARQKVWHFPKGKGSLNDVLDMTESFMNGGTDFQVPMDLAVDILKRQYSDERLSQGDIVLATDDDCMVSPAWLAAYQETKAKLDFRTYGLAVGMPRPGGTLASLSDDVRSVQEFHDPSVVADIFRTV